MQLTFPIHNIKIIDFRQILIKHVEDKVLNDLNDYNLIKNNQINIKNKEVKRFIYHHTIFELCEYILKLKSKQRIVIFYSPLIPPAIQLLNFTSSVELQDFFNSFVLKINKMLPIRILFDDTTSFNTLKREIKHDEGLSTDLGMRAKLLVDNFDISKFTFTKARYFAKRYGLTYLSGKYFQKIKNKQLILM